MHHQSREGRIANLSFGVMDVAIRTTTWAAAQQESLSRMTAASFSPGELMFATLLGIIDLPFFGATAAIGRPQVLQLNGPQYS